MSYGIEVTDFAYDEIQALKPFHRRKIVESINTQLTCETKAETRNRKLLTGVEPSFEHKPPIWELRVGEFRVYYDIDDELKTVSIRSVRHKPPHTTTEQII
jgi:mRNA-degrading endonuclease RelE of RelBE toxin-antitoxin system